MAIHSKEDIFPNLDDQIFRTSFLPYPLAKYKFPKRETDPNAAYQLVHDELLLDGNSRQNLAGVLPDMDGTGDPETHGRVPGQEPDRQR